MARAYGMTFTETESQRMVDAWRRANPWGPTYWAQLEEAYHRAMRNKGREISVNANAALLFGWLKTLYPIWARFGPEEMFVSAQVGLAELALSGCSMTSDHLYLFPNGSRLDDTIAAAAEVGLRFHTTRGAMSIGESAGGLPPDSLVEDEAAIPRAGVPAAWRRGVLSENYDNGTI